MAQRTVSHMYDSYDDAQAVVTELEAAGIPHSDISLVANADAHGRSSGTSALTGGGTSPADPADPTDTNPEAGGKRGAVAGTLLGGGAGLLAGIGALAIPGVGPVVAAGWLIATLTGAGVGAAGGSLIGSLTGSGVSHDEANVYAEGVKRGGSLVTVRTDEANASRVEGILQRHGSADWQQRRASYGNDWSRFEENTSERMAGTSTSVGSGASMTEAGSTYTPGTGGTGRL